LQDIGGTNAPNSSQDGTPFHALRILPPGDGSGGFIVASQWRLLRLDANGVIVTDYTPPYANYGNGSEQIQWYTLEIAPDNKTFWAAGHDNGDLFQFDVQSGRLLQRKHAVKYVPESET